MRKLFALMALCIVALTSVKAQEIPASTWGNMPPLHVEGRHLVDEYGNNVVLHGVMDTPSPWFNSYVNPTTGQEVHNVWGNVSDANVGACLQYFNKLFTAITDTAQGAYCNVFRLHLDPCWTNDNAVRAPGFTERDGKRYDPNGTEVGGEADIYHFSEERFKKYFKSVYMKIAKQAVAKGLYVIMRPPGVFPGMVKVGDYYNDYIMKVWDIVTQNEELKQYSGQIMIELGNEPVSLKNAKGQDDDKALCDFFQPVVDKMRENGYEGVIWGVGTGWQGNCRPYGKYPLVGKNIGYAVHNYVGWYGGDDKNFSVWGKGPYAINSAAGKAAYAEEFHASHPIMDTNPIVITEVDWSPEKAGTGHYNEHGNWVSSNYGTWATGSTSGWGAAYKYLMDKYDNISMTLSGTACYINIYDYVVGKRVVTPAFKKDMEKNGLDPWEGSGVACFAWYKEWAKENYARPDLSKPSDDPGLSLVSLTAEKNAVEFMVGQNAQFRMKAQFANGMDSYIPVGLCTVEAKNNDICAVKDGNLVGIAQGETETNITYTSPAGNKMEQPLTVKVLPMFSLSASAVNPSVISTGTYAENRGTYNTPSGGLGGWLYDAGIDISGYKYLVFQMRSSSNVKGSKVRFYDNDNFTGDGYAEFVISQDGKEIQIPFEGLVKKDGTALDLTNIKFVGVQTGGKNIFFSNVFLSIDGETDATSIDAAASQMKVISEEIFNVSGQRINNLEPGVNIIRQTLSNGETKSKKVFIDK